MKKFFFIITISAFLMTDFTIPSGHCVPVNGYNSYINTLPGGKDRQAENFNIIDFAQKEVITSESTRRQREIRFIKPVDVETLNSKYLMIAFEVLYKPAGNSRFSPDPAIYALLFEQKASLGIVKYTSQFIKWLDTGDIEEYKSADKATFCKLYRHLGVDDCIIETPETETLLNEVAIVTEAPRDIEIDAGQIVSGIIREKYIDPQIARKSDLQEILKKTSTKELEEKLSILERERPQKDSGGTDALERKLAEEKKLREQLEKRIETLEKLLKNVSLENNEMTFKGLNLRVVSGSNSPQGQGNGRGNLILGYIESSASGVPIEELLGNLSHKIITVEDKDEGEQSLLPDYGNGERQNDKSIIKFLLD